MELMKMNFEALFFKCSYKVQKLKKLHFKTQTSMKNHYA